MLPRLRFVVASLLIAILPMVFLGAGMAPSAHPTSPTELSRADKPVVLGPAEYSEAQYRQDRLTLSYARRETELNKLRILASAPLSNWIVAPAGAEPDNTATVATLTTDGPAVVTVNTTNSPPEKASEVTVSVTVAPIDKKTSEITVQTSPPEADKPASATPDTGKSEVSKPEANAPAAPSMSDAPRTTTNAIPSGQVFAALNPLTKAETSNLPQVHVVMTKPKPRARVVRRAKPAPTPPPAVQKPPPFFELFAWLFNIKPQPQTAAAQEQQAPSWQRPQAQPQGRSSIAPTAAYRTAQQP